MADAPERAALGKGFAVLADAQFQLAGRRSSAVHLELYETGWSLRTLPQDKPAITHQMVEVALLRKHVTSFAGRPEPASFVGSPRIRPPPAIQHEAFNWEVPVRLVDDPDFGQPVVDFVAPLGTSEIPSVSFREAAILPGSDVQGEVRERHQEQATQGPAPQGAEEALRAAGPA